MNRATHTLTLPSHLSRFRLLAAFVAAILITIVIKLTNSPTIYSKPLKLYGKLRANVIAITTTTTTTTITKLIFT